MPSTTDLEQFLITGLSLGGVYALSGVGMVVLYRATGVLYLAFGAVGAMGALIAWQLSQQDGWNIWLSFVVAILFGGVITLAYGMIFGPALAGRDPLVKATATLGLLLILLGVMDLLWPSSGGASRSLTIPTDNNTFQVGQISVTYTNVIALALGLVITIVTAAFLRFTKLGTAMRAMANDREITAALGVPVRRVEAAAWFGCGVLSGVAGVLLADLVALDSTSLTFLVISTLAATLVGRLRSIGITFVAALVIGLITAELTPVSSLSNYRDMTPFVVAAIALLVLNRRRVITVGRQGV
ncbi:MAG: branched-chain amino acid ABC transporter permease [Solirubrobacterales bacterium]|nr:branched-chain amino acid ABC transporter permease [Solirubrobacterales bacterium]